MANSIRIVEYATQNELLLDSYQQALVEDELRRVEGGWLRRNLGEWLSRFWPRGRPVRVRPDCQIIVEENGRLIEYLLTSDSVLYRHGSVVNHQFYMGLLLQEWLGIRP
ncbi:MULTISPECIES: hypothetical protein [Aliagarivorans]|uniref:hypothetical protein n=1 Tax=Aliagarivorans TaxID=882379 RepID=UPI00042685A5|nr:MULTISPECIES: hypothetical protein [Aliagarivorans]